MRYLIWVVLLSLLTPVPDVSLREELERMHASMAAAYKRDRGAVLRFYATDATITDQERTHRGRAAILEFWTRALWTTDWRAETFDTAAPSHGLPWAAGRYVGTRADGVRTETFFVRLLEQEADGQWKIAGEVLSSQAGTGTPADLEAAATRWLGESTPDRIDTGVARVYGALGVSVALVERGGIQQSCAGAWIHSRTTWRLASSRCRPAGRPPGAP